MTVTEDYLVSRRKSRVLSVPNHPQRPEIEHGIPVPLERRGGVRKFDHFYPFEDMKPGDSFWVPGETYCTAGAITKFSKRTGWKFVSRRQTKEGLSSAEIKNNRKLGTRVWRVS